MWQRGGMDTSLSYSPTLALRRLVMISGAAMMIGGAMLAIWQVAYFLKSGEWMSAPLGASISIAYAYMAQPDPDSIPALIRWFVYPESWFGLCKAINAIPAAGASVYIGWLFYAFSRMRHDR